MISVALFFNSTIWIPSSELLTAFEETLFILKIIYMYISVRGVIFIQSHTLHEINIFLLQFTQRKTKVNRHEP